MAAPGGGALAGLAGEPHRATGFRGAIERLDHANVEQSFLARGLGIAPAKRRSYYLALFAMASGLGFGVATLVAGQCADWLTVNAGGDLRPLFVVSAIARASCALVAARVHEPEASSVRSLIFGLRRRASAP